MSASTASIRKNSLVATVAIIGSRFFGLLREQVFAFFFGAGVAQDAFIAAFRIPNLLRDLFAEGALSQSFVTVFAQKCAKDDRDAFALARKVGTLLAVFMSFLVLLGIVFSPQIVSVIATGFSGAAFELTVRLNRILFPFILFVSLASLSMGMLNAKGKYFLPQSASTFFNIVSIGAGLFCAWRAAPEYVAASFQALWRGEHPVEDPSAAIRAITGMAFGTLLGGLAQWLVQTPALRKLGYRFRFDWDPRNPDVKRVLKLTGPAIVGGAAVQVNVMVNTFFASFLAAGSISYLNYSFRLMQFPLGIFGVAIATASAPVLARMIAGGRKQDFADTMRSSMRMSLFLGLPSAVGLTVLAEPIIALIYEHGRFGALDTVETAYALIAYSAGIAAYSLIKIYQPAYLAFDDAKTPMRISLLSIALNAAINGLFIRALHWPHWGLALGTSLLATLNLVLLAAFFRRRMPGLWDRGQFSSLFKIAAASLFMGICAWGALAATDAVFPGSRSGLIAKLARVFVPIMAAIPAYFGAAWALGIEDARSLIRSLKARFGD